MQDIDSVANTSLNTMSMLSSSDDFVTSSSSSSSDDNFLSDLAGSSDKLHLLDACSLSEVCHVASGSDGSCAVGLMSLTSDFDSDPWSVTATRSMSTYNKQQSVSSLDRLCHG